MTNYLTIVWLAWVTNTISPGGDGPRGNTWFHTNIASAVIVCPVPGFGNVTSTVPVLTNVVKFTIQSETINTARIGSGYTTPTNAARTNSPAP